MQELKIHFEAAFVQVLHFQDTIFVGGLRKSTTEDWAAPNSPN